ncbi:branched-chain amino acid ABC transporter permease [Desulfoplanes formicivorans]|uniref:ABC transporter permease n=1 Tax=Desulfoplanes formicivorans TaxID=1592317 RepID=A0A194AIZ2_9BACT|nr:branched-chain amino acid ABC transporter permease [Desulfoplanes formicivorans]GAU09298.1 ABC transporter permease [Desulfoplanes formicivorans]
MTTFTTNKPPKNLFSFIRPDNAMFPGLLLTLALLPLILPYYALGTEIVLFALAAVAFDLCLGYTGVMIFCQASFFGTGVYVTSLTLIHLTQNIFAAVFCGVAAAALLSLLFGWLASTRSGSYSVLLTLAFNELIYFIAYQWSDLTGGDDGLTGVPRPNLEIPGIFSIDLQSSLSFYLFAATVFLISFMIIRRITLSPFGAVLKGIRENEVRAQAIGYNVRLYKIAVFVLGGMFMGLAGSLYCMHINFAHLHSVHFETSGNIVMMVLIGGMGTLVGPVIGAGLITMASEFASTLWDRWLIIQGVVFILFVLFARGGIWGILESVREGFRKRAARKIRSAACEKPAEKGPENISFLPGITVSNAND